MGMAYPLTVEEEFEMRLANMNRKQRRQFDKLIKKGLNKKQAAKKVLGALSVVRR
jgi:hypothetical protein